MKRRSAVTLIALIPVLAHADFKPSAWQYRKLMHAEARPANSVLIEKDVYLIAQENLGDLRIVHATAEVPYLVIEASAQVKDSPINTAMQDRAVTSRGVEAVLVFPRGAWHNRLTLLTGLTNFKHKVQLLASKTEDGEWVVVKEGAYIFDFTSEEHHASLLTIDYPTSTRRYLKVVIEGAKDPAILAGAEVISREERPAIWQEMAKFDGPSAVEDSERKSTRYKLDLGGPGMPRDRLVMKISDAAFHRTVLTEISSDGVQWDSASYSTVYRIEDGAEGLTVPLYNTHRGRYVRLTMFHGDDRPLQLDNVTVEAIARHAVFPSREAGDYWMYFGNPQAHSPSYDLGMVLARGTLNQAVAVSADGRQENPGYRPPDPPAVPFSERYPGVLYGVLAMAVVALALLTYRFMQGVRNEGPPQAG